MQQHVTSDTVVPWYLYEECRRYFPTRLCKKSVGQSSAEDIFELTGLYDY